MRGAVHRLLFLATTVLAALHAWRTRGAGGAKVGAGVQPAV